MPRTTKPLTNTEVKQAKPKDKDYTLSDGNGLQLRVKTTGSKSWLFNYYRPFSKKRANLGLGSFPEVSLADARKQAVAARELVAKDIDPKEHRDDQVRKSKEASENSLESIARSSSEEVENLIHNSSTHSVTPIDETVIMQRIEETRALN